MICIGQGVVEWVAKRVPGDFGQAQGIGWQRDGRIIAGVIYEDFNGVNVFCHIAAEGALTRPFLWTIFDYPFNQLRVKRITVPVAATNGRSMRFVQHLGFRFEARLTDAHPSGDLLIYCMRQPQAQRWLNLRDSHANLHKARLAMAA